MAIGGDIGGPGYVLDQAGCLAGAIGGQGLADEEFAEWLDLARPGLAGLQSDLAAGRLPLLHVVGERADIAEARAALTRLSAGAHTIVIYGTGGSSLGGQTLAQLGGWNLPGHAKPKDRPRLRIYDNLDPESLGGTIATLDVPGTRFIVISKSGGTAETLTQAIVTIDAIKRAGLGARLPELMLGITEPDRPGKINGLRRLLDAHGIPTIAHHTGIGGRYAGLTNVGLIAAMAMGLDAVKLREGAQAVVDALRTADSPAGFAPAAGAALAVGLDRLRGVGIQVMMPYSDRLASFAHWFVQLWAESLGKNGEGSTPLAALGPVDQHSQLQLFMEGPREHLITMLRPAVPARGPVVDRELARLAGLDYMAGRAVGELVAAQSRGVAEALASAGRPVRILEVAAVDERTLGALMMHAMLETILAARLLDVDPFDQPGVELGKTLAVKRLGAAPA